MRHSRLETYQSFCVMLSVCALVLIGMSVSVSADDHAKDTDSYQFDILYVTWGGNPDHVSVFDQPKLGNEQKVHEHYVPQNSIQWALDHAPVVVVMDGGYEINNPITIDNSGARLIIGPKATIQAGDRFPRHASVIDVNRADNVRVFNLGTLKGNGGVGIQFDGRMKGQSGIDGGMIVNSGTLANVNAGCWMIDTANTKIPLALGDENMYAVLGMEGVHDAQIGTVGQLSSDGDGEGAAVEVTMNNKRVHINRVIAPIQKPGDMIVHLNNSHDVQVERATALTGSDDRDYPIVKSDLFDDHGLLYQLEKDRPLFGVRTERPDIMENKGLTVKNVHRVRNDVSGFSKEVSFPGFPPGPAVPPLNVNVSLTVNFEDGSSTEVFSNQYEFDLSK